MSTVSTNALNAAIDDLVELHSLLGIAGNILAEGDVSRGYAADLAVLFLRSKPRLEYVLTLLESEQDARHD